MVVTVLCVRALGVFHILTNVWDAVEVACDDSASREYLGPAKHVNPSREANRPTVDGYSTLFRGLARALLARLAVAAGRP